MPERLYASIAKTRAALAACGSLTNQIVVFRHVSGVLPHAG